MTEYDVCTSPVVRIVPPNAYDVSQCPRCVISIRPSQHSGHLGGNGVSLSTTKRCATPSITDGQKKLDGEYLRYQTAPSSDVHNILSGLLMPYSLTILSSAIIVPHPVAWRRYGCQLCILSDLCVSRYSAGSPASHTWRHP